MRRFFWLLFASSLFAGDIPAGQSIAVQGIVEAGENLINGARRLRRGSSIFSTDTVDVKQDAKVQLKFSDGGLVVLLPNTVYRIDSYQFTQEKSEVTINLIKGGFRAMTGTIGKEHPTDYTIKTPTATIGVRGTIATAVTDGKQTSFGCESGTMTITTGASSTASLSGKVSALQKELNAAKAAKDTAKVKQLQDQITQLNATISKVNTLQNDLKTAKAAGNQNQAQHVQTEINVLLSQAGITPANQAVLHPGEYVTVDAGGAVGEVTTSPPPLIASPPGIAAAGGGAAGGATGGGIGGAVETTGTSIGNPFAPPPGGIEITPALEASTQFPPPPPVSAHTQETDSLDIPADVGKPCGPCAPC